MSRTFTKQDTMAFADLSRDYNPVHFDHRFAEVKIFHSQICHGLLVASLLTEIGGQIGWLASGMNIRFKKPVYFGDTIACSFTITELDDRNRAKAEAVFKNQHDEIVIEASLSGILPGFPEKSVMEVMISEGDPTNKSAKCRKPVSATKHIGQSHRSAIIGSTRVARRAGSQQTSSAAPASVKGARIKVLASVAVTPYRSDAINLVSASAPPFRLLVECQWRIPHRLLPMASP